MNQTGLTSLSSSSLPASSSSSSSSSSSTNSSNLSNCTSSVSFPSAEKYFDEKKKHLHQKIFTYGASLRASKDEDDCASALMAAPASTASVVIQYDLIATLLESPTHKELTERILFETVRDVITTCPRELRIAFEDEHMIMTLLTFCPKIIRLKDEEDGLLLIHYLCVMEFPSHQILRYLVDEYPASVGIYGNIGDLRATPLHLKLMRTEINFEMVLYMVSSCPSAASLETFYGKYPLHLTLSVNPTSSRQQYFYYVLIHHLLSYFPEGAFKEIQEEFNCLSLVPVAGELTNVQESSPYSHLHSIHEEEEQEFEDVTVFIGQERYKVEIKVMKWSPTEKVRNSNDEQMKRLFDVHVERFTRRHLGRQWRR